MAHHSIHHAGRKTSASAATGIKINHNLGFLKQHDKELNRFLNKAFE